MAKPVPNVNDVSLADLVSDPYPTFHRLHRDAPIAMVEAANVTLVTRYADITAIEKAPDIFASSNPASLVHKVMGHTFMRKDGEAHRCERASIEPTFRAMTVQSHWTPIFERIADDLIDQLAPRGEADLFNTFAAPMASLALIELIGFKNMDWADLAEWSQNLMDGCANYGADPEISRKAAQAGAAIDAGIDAVIDDYRADPTPCVISSIVNSAPGVTRQDMAANIKTIVGGGLNEPRDAILTSVMALLTHQDQKQRVLAEGNHWTALFDEAVRWISPIGMYPRLLSRDAEIGGVKLLEGQQVGLCVSAANREVGRIEAPDDFNIFRQRKPTLAFGSGPHFCAGKWVARRMVGEIAVPRLMKRLKNLRPDPARQSEIKGWVFRGPTALPVVWDA